MPWAREARRARQRCQTSFSVVDRVRYGARQAEAARFAVTASDGELRSGRCELPALWFYGCRRQACRAFGGGCVPAAPLSIPRCRQSSAIALDQQELCRILGGDTKRAALGVVEISQTCNAGHPTPRPRAPRTCCQSSAPKEPRAAGPQPAARQEAFLATVSRRQYVASSVGLEKRRRFSSRHDQLVRC